MRHLKLLQFSPVDFCGRLDFLSNELRYLSWCIYPFDYLPSNFQPDNLVGLILNDSRIKKLWKDTKPLPNLRLLDLYRSESLIELPHFGEAPNLERLCLKGCIQLRQIDASIGLLKKLTELDLRECENLISVPSSILGLNSLEYLSLSGCSKLRMLLDEPRDGEHLKKLCRGEAPIHSLSASSILPEDLCSISRMRELDLSYCSLRQIPDTIGNLHCLEWLNLRGNKFGTLPSLKELSKLYYINLASCKQLKCLPELPSRTHLSSEIYLSPFRDVIGSRGINIFDCPELVDREGCSSMCFSWMMQIVKAHHQYPRFSPLRKPCVESVIQGSEIPRWFNNQHEGMGNLMIIDTPPLIQHDNNWIGIACCVIFRFHDRMITTLPIFPLRTEPLHTLGVEIPWVPFNEEDMKTSDRIWLFYFTRQQLISQCCVGRMPDRADFKFKFEIRRTPLFESRVKEYGYRWVYEEDVKHSNVTTMHSGDLLPQKRKAFGN
ncbi:disease resistance-like protein CSA1 [Abrus precatorius]|uniref:Disease resistance-like protein CSA1 n=1 Tax=Abrus precatorius TaxID=3816 RepID=A0A8B8KW90_ABRPR|nr:disease resistance-like protein CSA1 [Abrus precatorius]